MSSTKHARGRLQRMSSTKQDPGQLSTGQRRPKSDPRPPKSDPSATQDRPRAAEERPRATQDRPRPPQDRPKTAPRPPKTAPRPPQDRPKITPRSPKNRPRAILQFEVDFLIDLAPSWSRLGAILGRSWPHLGVDFGEKTLENVGPRENPHF